MAAKAFTSRGVAQRLLSVEQGEGAGARVRRSIGRPELRTFDPFLMLDEFKVGRGAGFPSHPHRGIQTVTYMLEGKIEHEDFTGHRGVIGPYDLQWMNAGRGIVHSEIPVHEKDGPVPRGLQLWINLSRKNKMSEPTYQELLAKDIPTVEKDGITAHVIAGEALGAKSPVRSVTPAHYVHFIMEPNSVLEQPIAPGWNAFMYTLKGRIYVGDEAKTVEEAHHTLTLDRPDGADGVRIATKEDPGEFVLISGEPIGEPIVPYGPMVMTTPEEIQQAFVDYQLGRNGFERAPGWRAEIDKRMNG